MERTSAGSFRRLTRFYPCCFLWTPPPPTLAASFVSLRGQVITLPSYKYEKQDLASPSDGAVPAVFLPGAVQWGAGGWGEETKCMGCGL